MYNARKRGGDSAAFYFQRTESVAGVKDMRFQGESIILEGLYFGATLLTTGASFLALMPDVLHWLGIKKIDVMCSMSDMKHDVSRT